MANELQYNDAALTGSTLYVVVWNSAGQAWNGTTFATYTSTRSDFDVAATEISGTGFWQANFPGTAGYRRWAWYLQDGGSPATTDVKLLEGTGYWDGTNILSQAPAAGAGNTYQLGNLGYILRGDKIQFVDAAGETGVTDLYVMLQDFRGLFYNSTVNSFATHINSLNWSHGLFPLTEYPGQVATGVAIYATYVPTNVPIGAFSLIVQQGTTPSSPRKFTGQVYYDGTNVIPIDGIMSAVYGAVKATSHYGSGSVAKEITVTSQGGVPIPLAQVFISTDAANANVECGPMVTDDAGKVTAMLNPGTYYRWAHRANAAILNPVAITVP